MKYQSIKILLLLLFFSVAARAQLVWFSGDVTLITGIKLRGELCYQPQADALLVRTSDKWRTYTADQIRQFQYTDQAAGLFHYFATYEIPQSTGETRSVIFEELLPNALVPLLQLPAQRGVHWLNKVGLPLVKTTIWQTGQPWYVWLEGRPVALDAFVETELNGLVVVAPKAVQQWAITFPRPANPKALARWLCYFNGRVTKAQSTAGPTIVTRVLPY